MLIESAPLAPLSTLALLNRAIKPDEYQVDYEQTWIRQMPDLAALFSPF
jgi:hypothetical protein